MVARLEVAGLYPHQPGRISDHQALFDSRRTTLARSPTGSLSLASRSLTAAAKYLYFLASTDPGPVKNWFDQSNTDMLPTSSVYLVALAKATPNPLLKESDEEGAAEPRDKESKAQRDPIPRFRATITRKPERREGRRQQKRRARMREGEAAGRDRPRRNRRAGRRAADRGGDTSRPWRPAAEGQIFYIRRATSVPAQGPAGHGKPTLRRFDLKTREEETLAEGIDDFRLSADGKKMIYRFRRSGRRRSARRTRGSAPVVGIVDAGQVQQGRRRAQAGRDLGAGRAAGGMGADLPRGLADQPRLLLRTEHARGRLEGDAEKVRGNPSPRRQPRRSEPRDPDDAQRAGRRATASSAAASGCTSRSRSPSACSVPTTRSIRAGIRFKKIYGGAYWDPSLRAPLVAPGVDVKPGDFLLAVDGKEIKADSEVYRAFEGTVGKRVELKVGPNPDGSGARTIIVEPIADESGLRNRAWVEGNLRKVHERTKGRVAYVYVPNTADVGYDYFKRYFFPQADKEAIIVDERFNGGGQVADYYIELLRRPLVSYWATRHGEPIRTPNAAILGPKVMIIDETAGSGGDLLPWMFRKFAVGKLVGKRTWGGLVGILGFPSLMDGGFVTAPDLAIFTEDGWVVENVGVAPDVEVEQDPAAVAAGKDPQLDRAIELRA